MTVDKLAVDPSGGRPAEVPVPVSGVEQLVAARQARGLGASDIAAKLGMSTRQVEALERGDWPALPGQAFVRGALRSYGKTLGLDVAPLLASVGGQVSAPELRIAASLDAPMPRSGAIGVSSGATGGRLAWMLLGVAAVIAIALYSGGALEDTEQTARDPLRTDRAGQAGAAAGGSTPSGATLAGFGAGPSPAGAGAGGTGSVSGGSADASAGSAQPLTPLAPLAPRAPSAPPPAMPGTAAPGSGSGATPGAAAPGGPDSGSSGTPGTGAAPAPVAAPVQPGAATAAAPSRQVGSTSSVSAPSQVASVSPASPAGDARRDGGAAAQSAEETLRLAFRRESWVEIRSAGGELLLTGLQRAGSSHVLSGRRPFEMVIGNAAHVTLEVDGKPVDLAPHAPRGVARFKLE
jgi:cytoskeleton protein RodZ